MQGKDHDLSIKIEAQYEQLFESIGDFKQFCTLIDSFKEEGILINVLMYESKQFQQLNILHAILKKIIMSNQTYNFCYLNKLAQALSSETLKHLLNNNFNGFDLGYPYTQNALHAVVMSKECDLAIQIKLIEQLLASGADVNSVNSYKRTPLHMAFSNFNIEVLLVLFNHNPDFNLEDFSGKIPFEAFEYSLNRSYFNENEITKKRNELLWALNLEKQFTETMQERKATASKRAEKLRLQQDEARKAKENDPVRQQKKLLNNAEKQARKAAKEEYKAAQKAQKEREDKEKEEKLERDLFLEEERERDLVLEEERMMEVLKNNYCLMANIDYQTFLLFNLNDSEFKTIYEDLQRSLNQDISALEKALPDHTPTQRPIPDEKLYITRALLISEMEEKIHELANKLGQSHLLNSLPKEAHQLIALFNRLSLDLEQKEMQRFVSLLNQSLVEEIVPTVKESVVSKYTIFGKNPVLTKPEQEGVSKQRKESPSQFEEAKKEKLEELLKSCSFGVDQISLEVTCFFDDEKFKENFKNYLDKEKIKYSQDRTSKITLTDEIFIKLQGEKAFYKLFDLIKEDEDKSISPS